MLNSVKFYSHVRPLKGRLRLIFNGVHCVDQDSSNIFIFASKLTKHINLEKTQRTNNSPSLQYLIMQLALFYLEDFSVNFFFQLPYQILISDPVS